MNHAFFFRRALASLQMTQPRLLLLLVYKPNQIQTWPNVSGMVSLIFHRGYLSYGFDLPPGLGQ